MTFPFALSEQGLVAEDFDRFALFFTQAVTALLPCETVYFVPEESAGNAEVPRSCKNGLEQARKKRMPVVIDGGGPTLCLPLWSGSLPVCVALLTGVGREFSRMSGASLREQSLRVSRALQDVKERYTDPVTGLPTGAALHEELHEHLRTGAAETWGNSVLALLEIYPQVRDAERGLAYIRRAAAFLQSLFGASSHLYHAGSGVFALLWHDLSLTEARKTGDILLRRLRREDFVRAHLGLAAFSPGKGREKEDVAALLDQAWQALRVSRRRGPFGLCAHLDEEDLDAHPLRPLSLGAMKQLARLWRGKKRFSLVLLRQDQAAVSNHFGRRVRAAIDKKTPYLFLNQREVYVFLDGAGEKQAGRWAGRFRAKMKATAGGTFSMGIAVYPCLKYKKTQIALNCRKALIHAEFSGPDSVAVFDGVSLNISGDVYYNEGDLAKAVREYRQGLVLDPDNVNLLNSLGVSHVQLKRSKTALAYFEKALRVDEKNFMALFNLGFVHHRAFDMEKALHYFERALAVNGSHFDLLLQLGKLYCRQERYREAAKVLNRCGKNLKTETARNGDMATLYRLLGEAQAGLGKKRQAMSHLQKALSVNSRDSLALSMLGKLYAQEKEGDDIALSFCKQAVVLDGGKSEHWSRLGWVQWQRGDTKAAVDSLRQCLRLDRKNADAAFWLARIYEDQGRARHARRLYERVLRLRPDHRRARNALA